MNVKKNYLYNVVYQLIAIIIPMITVPYVARVIGSEGIGLNAYSNSLAQYFVLLGTLGTSLYGNRAIAYVKENEKKLSLTFWSIFFLRIAITLIALVLFYIFLFVTNNFKAIYLIQSLYIIASMVDISWLFMGLEDFKKTVVRNLIVKIISVILIFSVIKSPKDLALYVLILGGSQVLGQLTMWIYLPKVVNKCKVNFKHIKKHIFPSIQLFIPQVAIQVYVVLNKTMLGYFTNFSEVGYFDNADKLVKIILSIVTALGVVMLPRVANTFAKGDMAKVNSYVFKSFNFVTYISVPLMFGLAGIAKNFIPIYLGSGYEKTAVIIMIISPIIVLIAWSNVIGQQYLLPIGKNVYYTVSVCIGATTNLAINFFLIHSLSSYGVSIGTVIAELMVTAVQLHFVKNELPFKKLFRGLWRFFFAGIVMYAGVWLIGNYLVSGMIGVLIQVGSGGIIYLSVLLIMKEETNQRVIREALGVTKIFQNRN